MFLAVMGRLLLGLQPHPVCCMSAGAGSSQSEGWGEVGGKGGEVGLDSEGGVPVARVACSVSELESGGCSYRPTFWHNPAFVLRRQSLPAAPGEAVDAQDRGGGVFVMGMMTCIKIWRLP